MNNPVLAVTVISNLFTAGILILSFGIYLVNPVAGFTVAGLAILCIGGLLAISLPSPHEEY